MRGHGPRKGRCQKREKEPERAAREDKDGDNDPESREDQIRVLTEQIWRLQWASVYRWLTTPQGEEKEIEEADAGEKRTRAQKERMWGWAVAYRRLTALQEIEDDQGHTLGSEEDLKEGQEDGETQKKA